MTAPVIALWRPPFAAGSPVVQPFPAGTSIAGMIAALGLPEAFAARGSVIIAGVDGREHVLDRAAWQRIRLKPGQMASFHLALGGEGGDRRGKGTAAIGVVIAMAVALAATAVSGGALAPAFGPLFAKGALGAKLMAGGISLLGALAQSALSKPPKRDDERAAGPGSAAISGNAIGAGAAIPRVIGTRRVFPPFLSPPLIVREGKDEIVEAVLGLAGPHRLDDIRLGDTPVADAADVTIELREGWPTDGPLGLVTRHARTAMAFAALAGHALDSEDPAKRRLADQLQPEKSLPQWRAQGLRMTDEAWLHFSFAEGLNETGSDMVARTVPMRMRLKIGDGAWINLPELQFTAEETGEVRASVILKRRLPDGPVPGAPASTGFTAAYAATPGQASPATDGWTASTAFGSAPAPAALIAGTEAASPVANVHLTTDAATLFLDPETFPAGRWTIEIQRGASFRASQFNASAYTLSGTVLDFFAHAVVSGERRIPVSPKNTTDALTLTRVSAVTLAHPIAGGSGGSNLALIAIRAKNRSLEAVNVKASGYVPDWDGTAWANWTTTSNPAPHFRDITVGRLSGDPLPEDLVDDDELIAWRADCSTRGWSCDHVAENQTVQELRDIVAGCGYARPRQAEMWGVTRDRDRSGDDPVQVFTARNSAGLTMAKAFARLPDALRCVFRDAGDEEREREIVVFRPGREGAASPRYEEARYEGLTSEAAIRERALFDLKQGEMRAAFWSFSAPAEALRCTKGDLIAVSHDMLSAWTAAGRITGIETEGGAIAAIHVDTARPGDGAADLTATTDMLAVPDLGAAGLRLACQIRRADGTLSTHALDAAPGETGRLVFETPAALDADANGVPAIRAGCLVAIGPTGWLTRRLIVADIAFDADLVARISAVDEAPELWS